MCVGVSHLCPRSEGQFNLTLGCSGAGRRLCGCAPDLCAAQRTAGLSLDDLGHHLPSLTWKVEEQIHCDVKEQKVSQT